MEKKNTILLTVIAVATLLVAVIGATFAYFSAKINETNKTPTVIKAAELGITFTGTKEITGGDEIMPGWTAEKKFTVENTSDYDMTFDINFTNITNTFIRQKDLVYSMSAEYIASTNESVTANTTEVKMVKDDGEKATFSISGQMPATSTDIVTANGTEKSSVKIVRVFIPAHTTQEFIMNVEYVNAVDDEGNPVDQNDDQGAEFKTTVGIVANGIAENATPVKATTTETSE